MADGHLFDTSALFCYMQQEEGFEIVDRVLHQGAVYASFLSFMEFYYIVHQEDGETVAENEYQRLKQLPIQIIESDEPLRIRAARIKATQRLSLADAWVAATAERLDAVLVHKDPEFDALDGRIRMLRLPSKKGRNG